MIDAEASRGQRQHTTSQGEDTSAMCQRHVGSVPVDYAAVRQEEVREGRAAGAKLNLLALEPRRQLIAVELSATDPSVAVDSRFMDRLREKQRLPFSQLQDQNLWKCWLGLVRPGFATFS